MKTIRKLLILFIIVGFIIHAKAQEKVLNLSLTQACQIAVDSNLQVINSRFEILKSNAQLNETRSKLYPQIDGFNDLNYYYAIPKMMMPGEMFGASGDIPVEIGTKYDWSGGLKASLTLIDASNYTSLKIARSIKMMSQLSLDQKKEEIVYQVSQVYYLSQATSIQINYLKKNLVNTDRLLEIIKQQSENGLAQKIDYAKVTVTKNNLLTQIENLVKIQQQQINLLRFLTGLNNNTDISLTDSLFVDSPQFDSPDFHSQTDIKLMDKQMEVALLNKQASDQSYLPTLSTSAQFFFQGQQNEFNYFHGSDKFFKVGYIGLNLNVPIFHGFEKQAKIQQHKFELLQLQNSRKNLANSLSKDFEDAKNQFIYSLMAVTRQRENIKVAEDDYNITMERYNQQISPLSELMLSDNALTEARLSYVDALLQLKNAELEIKKIRGELLKF